MKIPAVAIAAVFAGGIVLGSRQSLAAWFVSPFAFLVLFLAAGVLLVCGVWQARENHLGSAAIFSLALWCTLGVLAIRVADQPLPATHVLTAVAAHRIRLATPLRWQGRLRDEPRRLPWGTGIEVELNQVEFEGAAQSIAGGMRVAYAANDPAHPLPELHAGDEVQITAKARLPAVFKDDGAFDRRDYLAQQGIHLVASLRAAALMERIAPAQPSVGNWLAGKRARLRETLDALFPAAPEPAGLLRAMLLGDRSFVDRDESKSFQATGTFHVLVLAGLHVSALAFFLFWCGRGLRLRRSVTSLLALALLLAYVAVVEQRPPVVRAALMAGMVFLGWRLFRRLDLLNSAAVAALLILLARPLELFDSSFQLSFLAMACIGGLAAPWLARTVEPYSRALRGWRDVTRDSAHAPRQAQFRIDLRALEGWMSGRLRARTARFGGTGLAAFLSVSFRVWEIFVLSLVMQIGMLPMMATEFHRVALAGPFANLVAVPLTGVLVPLGFLTLGAAHVFRPAAQILAVPLGWLIALLTHSVAWFARLPHWSYRIPGPPRWLFCLFFVVFLALAAAMRMGARRTARAGFAALLVCGVLIAVHPFSPRVSAGKLEVTALDVAQGDSIFVVFPHGKTLLIDSGGAFGGFRPQERFAGPDPGEEAVSPYLWSRGFQRLDVVALTHAHQDHIGGLTAILENFRVGRLWIGREVSSPAQAALEDLARHKHIPIEHERRGETFDWDGVHGEVLWPEAAPEEIAPSAKNDDSLVLRLAFGKRVVLLSGDIEKESERQILAETNGDSLHADVLKVGHHGSRNSTMPEFLEKVHPQVALISAGTENPYGHPSPEVLERLGEAGVRILRTDKNGAIHVMTDGDKLEISCFLACAEPEHAVPSVKTVAPEQDEQPQD